MFHRVFNNHSIKYIACGTLTTLFTIKVSKHEYGETSMCNNNTNTETETENRIKNPKNNSLLSAVGNTPLIYLKSVSKATGCHIYGKAEFLNPTFSVKDRAAKYMIEKAESSGLLFPGGTIVEATGGNTGISLAQLGQ